MSTKEKVLQKLKTNTDFVSGERLAQELQLSRTAIWKAIKELEKAGYQIEHHSTGYRYQASDVLDAAEIAAGIQQPLTIRVLDTSVSTMKDAQMAVLNGEEPPILVVADMQEAPRGRFNRPFFALEKAGIYMSILLKPDTQLHELPQYTVLMAVAVAQAIDTLAGVNTQIKWVNDIYLNGKKFVGILSEAMMDVEANSLKHVIIGMGINFSIPQEKFPAELQERATSLFANGEPTITRNQLIIEIWNRFFQLLEQKDLNYLSVYREKSFVLGKQVTFQQKSQPFTGKAVGISDTGELLVDLDGEITALSSGEISLSSIQ
ncbi:biotin--[acetyl-CoA-carboxylase] ligase [Enterococcus pallens]|uniref:Bifunctional ligase/repressor BirA n=1 Tax=Enterococcus pallens ATCC BAA-351 TaxID=1158607 RepID=R2SLH7_9ENTE|nr:biotin--[acetyl-CoA-carboxylase] ligase [Enterococcus pallens]EOH95980.1 biotin-[acetyl-CoA-carboxylase] ligase [Enterococcus pallens ATCC BAA-351]EOU21664.1 biotin-[acetyl-CoA-carboxylase] ligase [Enterococcus pallens ATCC BAA-351]OJG77712.1 biotin-[acetyl-CoA-carboxylase] ligase [Enterococcus pallens]